MRLAAAFAAIFWLSCSAASAQSQAPTVALETPVAPPAEPASNGVRLVAGTPVSLILDEAVSSNGRSRGDHFAIRLAAPILVDGQVVAPAGALGQGEVVYAEPGGAGGAPGKLVLAARYIDVGPTRLRLKAFNLSAGGEANFREMQTAAGIIGPAVMLINGRNVLYPSGMRARAKVAEDTIFPAIPAAPQPSTANPAPGPSPSGLDSAAIQPTTNPLVKPIQEPKP